MANISVQEIKVTEEHARGHHVDDRISKIQPVNKSIWQTTQFPPQPILGGLGGCRGRGRNLQIKGDERYNSTKCNVWALFGASINKN